MRSFKSYLLATILLLSFSGSGSYAPKPVDAEIILVGSTPGDELIKSMLSLPSGTNVDFIKWNLKLNSKSSFVLDLVFGESQPNTLGFKNGGEKRSITGTFSLNEFIGESKFQETVHLKSASFPGIISLIKVNQNLFHLLSPQNRLMNGNGGWSYSLNRKNPVTSGKILFSSIISEDQSLQLIFDGRTPCREIAIDHPEMKASQACFKLKWRLILNRDSVTHQPTTCNIRNIVDNQPRTVSGKWKILNGTDSNPTCLIYKIEVDNLAEPILLLAGDTDVLFFLDKNKVPLIGNEDFSFTLNKKNSSDF